MAMRKPTVPMTQPTTHPAGSNPRAYESVEETPYGKTFNYYDGNSFWWEYEPPYDVPSKGGTIVGVDAGRGYTFDNDGNLIKAPASFTPTPATKNDASTSAPAATNPYRKEVPEHLKGGEPNGGYNFEDTTEAAIRNTATGGSTGSKPTVTIRPAGSGSSGGGSLNGIFDWLSGSSGSGNPLGDLFGSGGILNPGTGGGMGGNSGGGYGGGSSYETMLKNAYEQQAAARADALEKMIAAYGAQNATIDQQYDQAVRDAYANARLSAIGNNEALAAQGLAGGLYQNPYSGYSETSRVAQDNAMRSNMFAAQMARNQAKAEVERDILQLRAQGMYDAADLAAAQMEALINLQMQLDEQKYQREIDAWNMQQASQ